MNTDYLDPDCDPAVVNVKPLAAAMLAKCQRLVQAGPLTYETYMISQGVEPKSTARALLLNLTQEQRTFILNEASRNIVHLFDVGLERDTNQLLNQKRNNVYMYKALYESVDEPGQKCRWNNLAIQQSPQHFYDKFKFDIKAIKAIDIALYSSSRVADFNQLPMSMVAIVHQKFGCLQRGGFNDYDDFQQAFIPLHRVRLVDLEFRLKFDVVIASEDIRKILVDKQECIRKMNSFDVAHDREPGYSQNLISLSTIIQDSVIRTQQWPHFTEENMLDFDIIQQRAAWVLLELLEVQHEFERQLIGMDMQMIFPDKTPQQVQAITLGVFHQRFQNVVKAIKRLRVQMMMLCNYLPEEAVQSSETFLDFLHQISATTKFSQHAYMQQIASILRSGFLILNHVGRSYFKYVVEYVLHQYRKIVNIDGVYLVPPDLREIGYDDDFFHIVHDDQLGESVQAARRDLGRSPTDVVRFVENINTSRFTVITFTHTERWQIKYTSADGTVFDLTNGVSMDGQTKALLRIWEDPNSGALTVQLFAMDNALYTRGRMEPGARDQNEYIVYQTGFHQVWRYYVRRRRYQDLLTIMQEPTLRDAILTRLTKGRVFSEYLKITGITSFEHLQRSIDAFTKLREVLETLDSAQTTQVFCTQINQVQLLMVEMNSLAREMSLQFSCGVGSRRNLIYSNLISGMKHLPLVIQYSQQGEAVRFGLLLAKRQIIKDNPSSQPLATRSLLTDQIGKLSSQIILKTRFKDLYRVLQPSVANQGAVASEELSVLPRQPPVQALQASQQDLLRQRTNVRQDQVEQQPDVQALDDSDISFVEAERDPTFDVIFNPGSQHMIEEEKAEQSQEEVYYITRFSIIENDEPEQEMTSNFASLDLGKRPAEPNAIVEENSAKRQRVSQDESAVHQSQEGVAKTLLERVLSCDASERAQIRLSSTYKDLGANHFFKREYNVHWRLTLFMRHVQAANLVADDNLVELDKLLCKTVREFMAQKRLSGTKELKAYIEKKDQVHQ